MSQNFSKMSDIYIPELIELDSYWQKAVEDAICDTLKGEKRLFYAIRNRKKINKKLKKLGLRPNHSGRCSRRANSPPEDQEVRSPSNAGWDSSATSLEQDVLSQGAAGSSGSKSRSCRETPPEKYKNPDRPLLGDGSLEKMTKSQNNFNYEPMGMDERSGAAESEEEEAAERPPNQCQKKRGRRAGSEETSGKDTMVEWLHVREGSAFPPSDTDGSRSDFQITGLHNVHGSSLDINSRNSNSTNEDPDSQKIPKMLDPQEDLFWENEVKNALRENLSLDQRLNVALAKREILNDSLKSLRMGDSSDKIEIGESVAKSIDRKWRNKRLFSPFIRFYLEVYRELCHKRPVKEIAQEAAKRWRIMPASQKSQYQGGSNKD